MINNTIMHSDEKKTSSNSEQKPKKMPDEIGGIQVDEFIKITDPSNGKVLLAKRGES